MLYFINCAAVDDEWMNEWGIRCMELDLFYYNSIYSMGTTHNNNLREFSFAKHTHIDRNQNTQIICCYHRQICLANN